MFKIFTYMFLILMPVCISKNLPDYVNACSRSDQKLDECMVNNANQAIPYVLKGDEEFHIPNLLPLKVPEITIQSDNNLKMQFKDCELHGLETSAVKKMHMDFDNRKVSIQVNIDHLNVIANYNINGRILILPVQGNGPSNITIAGGIYNYEFTFDLMKRPNGKEYIMFKTNNLEYKAKRIYLTLDNLFNGDKVLGNTMNKFLDENWREVTDDLYPSLKGAVAAIVTSIARGLFSKIPFDDLFLP